MRTSPLAALVCFSLLFSSRALAEPQPLELMALGEPRQLPERILGASAEPFWDNYTENPDVVAALKTLKIGFLRFPGGSQSNYYDWKRGLFFVEPGQDNADYYARFVTLSNWVSRKYPNGIFLERYKAFSDEIGAELLIVPNFETASVEDQAAWFKHLAKHHAVTKYLELGNEYWAAMGQDPGVLKRWPDEPTSQKISRRYLAAIKPYLPEGAKIAWQAAAPSFRGEPSQHGKVMERLRQWNEDLRPEPWFDAVTIHLYPRLNEVLSAGAAREELTPALARRNLHALMARMDEGLDTVIAEVVQHVPGKEIWITEWNPAGTEGAGTEDRVETTTPAMLMQLVTRSTLAMLRQPPVTMSLFFSLKIKPTDNKCAFVETKSGYQPTPLAVTLAWLNDAANGGVSYQRYVAQGNPRIPGGGVRQESFGAVEAGLFRGQGRVVMLLQNCSGEERLWRSGAALKLGPPASVEHLSMPELLDSKFRAAKIESDQPTPRVQLPPWSLTRVVWNER